MAASGVGILCIPYLLPVFLFLRKVGDPLRADPLRAGVDWPGCDCAKAKETQSIINKHTQNRCNSSLFHADHQGLRKCIINTHTHNVHTAERIDY